jgi:hypothetical protein
MEDLSEQITSAQRLVKTDAYQMSIGEIVSMYENGELIIDPEFQRLVPPQLKMEKAFFR